MKPLIGLVLAQFIATENPPIKQPKIERTCAYCGAKGVNGSDEPAQYADQVVVGNRVYKPSEFQEARVEATVSCDGDYRLYENHQALGMHDAPPYYICVGPTK